LSLILPISQHPLQVIIAESLNSHLLLSPWGCRVQSCAVQCASLVVIKALLLIVVAGITNFFYNGKIKIRKHMLFSFKMNSNFTGVLTREHGGFMIPEPNLEFIAGGSYIL